MRRILPWLLLLSLAACDGDDPALPAVVPDGTYTLEHIDGSNPFADTVRVVRGKLVIEDGRYEWSATTSLWPPGTGTVSHFGTARRTAEGIEFTPVIDGRVVYGEWDPPMLIASARPGWIYHWRYDR